MSMKHKLVSKKSSFLLQYFNQRGQTFFHTEEVYKLLEGHSKETVDSLIRRMVENGLLLKIKNKLYHIIPYEADSQNYSPNWHIAGSEIAKPIPHYIGYYSALQIHELTTQPSYIEQVVVQKQLRPSLYKLKHIQFQFIFHNKKHFFGYKETWIDDFHKLPVSDLEKTIVDCLYKPDYASGIVEISKAIFKAREKINFQKLGEYINQFGAQSVRKRLGFLLELLAIAPGFSDELLRNLSNSIVSLDPALPSEGKYLTKWKLQLNVDLKTITRSITT